MSLSEKQQDMKGEAVFETEGSSPSLEQPNASLEQPNAGLINASGHVQELQRHFSLLSLCSVAITTGNTWVAIGGGIVSCFLEVLRKQFKSDPCRRSLRFIMEGLRALFTNCKTSEASSICRSERANQATELPCLSFTGLLRYQLQSWLLLCHLPVEVHISQDGTNVLR